MAKTPAKMIAAACLLLAGCRGPDGLAPTKAPLVRVESLAVQQAKAYPETVTGLFVPLVDFEDIPGGKRGSQQVGSFAFHPPTGQAACRFVVNITRTGASAMEVNLPAGSTLVFAVAGPIDLSDYSLLSLAVYSEAFRDDLCVALATEGASWTSHRTLLKPGWNTVLVDIQRLRTVAGIDLTAVRSIGLSFADAAGPVRFNLDDIMLVDNRRQLQPAPEGTKIVKNGLDYELSLPGRDQPIVLAQGSDGLWRLGGEGLPTLQLAAPGHRLPVEGEHLELMGPRKVGCVELLEVNPIRVRLASTWYFPTRAGEWVSLAVRQIRWEYTLYADGRWVTHMVLNNSGGQEIGSLRMWLNEEVAWSAGAISRDLVIHQFQGPVAKWSYLLTPDSLRRKTLLQNYLKPGTVRPTIAAADRRAMGDPDRGGFDESQGCYCLRSVEGHCRFTIVPPVDGLLDPVFKVAGDWRGPVSVNAQGLAVRKVVQLDDGSVLFVIPGWIQRPMDVEVAGKVSLETGQ